MARALIFIVATLCFFGCRSIRYVPVVEVRDSIITSPIDTVIIPPDSGAIKALLRCDEQGRVVMESLETANGENLRLQLRLDSLGNLLAKSKTEAVRHLEPKEPIIIYRDRQVPVPVERKLSKWESVKMEAGGYAIVIGLLAVLIFFGRFAKRIRK